jgi:hypothetical protein
LGDIGGAFGMGAVGGGIWHMVKGSKNSPSGQRLRGGLEVGHCVCFLPDMVRKILISVMLDVLYDIAVCMLT